MIEWIIKNKEWIFSGIGILFISGIGWLLKRIFCKKKKSKPERTINLQGKKSVYIERNEGEININ
ncbi:hypothetical protein EZS27_015378 [termite gut metagenome]|uniref:Uncharacterized protein n=1 Tax=termite gut metagenome TaxID=433724 RepID=A0A5J4RRU8_9ZZZZ